MRVYIFFALALQIVASCSFSLLEGANLHAIIVADTKDRSIGRSVNQDLLNMKSIASKIAKNTSLKLKSSVLSSKNASPSKLLACVKKLKVGKDDVVFFYFSGHGYRTASKGNIPWPNLEFSSLNKAVEFELITKKLSEKKPRLLLAIADACNGLIADAWAPLVVYKSAEKALAKDQIQENYKKLFLKTKGRILITSSESGELSWCGSDGSLYTNAFLRQLQSVVSSLQTPSWENLLGWASLMISDEQHPYYEINISYL
jgi:hypothetical protein